MQRREITEQQLEQFLLDGRGLASHHGMPSRTGSFAAAPRGGATAPSSARDSPMRSPWRSTVDLNTTLSDAEALIKQLSSAADAEEAAAAAAAAHGTDGAGGTGHELAQEATFGVASQ